ncbi:MAG: hypothetical protein F6K58_21420, partial [Symploca sp. SIO2E9]|nr:hypothetical protein [Symploca sp. SIO2E9]
MSNTIIKKGREGERERGREGERERGRGGERERGRGGESESVRNVELLLFLYIFFYPFPTFNI